MEINRNTLYMTNISINQNESCNEVEISGHKQTSNNIPDQNITPKSNLTSRPVTSKPVLPDSNVPFVHENMQEAANLLLNDFGNMALGLMALQSQVDDIHTRQGINQSKAAGDKREDQIEQHQKAVEEQIKAMEEAEKWGFLGKIFRWIGVAVVAAVSAVASIYSGGSSIALGAVIISALLATEEVVSLVTDEMMEAGIIGSKVAGWIKAVTANPDAVFDQAIAPVLPENIREKVSKAVHIIQGAARTVVSAVGTGGAGIVKSIFASQEVVGQITQALEDENLISHDKSLWIRSATGDPNAIAERIAISLLPEEDQEKAIIAMKVINMVGRAIMEYALGGSGSNNSRQNSVASTLNLTAKVAGEAADTGVAAMQVGQKYAEADSLEAQAEIKRTARMIEQYEAIEEETQEMLEEIMEHQNQTRQMVISMLRSVDNVRQCVISG